MSCSALYIRYTPGRRGSEPTYSFASNDEALTGRSSVRQGRQLPGPGQHLPEHGRGEDASLGVVTAAMVGIDQMPGFIQSMLPAMSEGKSAALQAAGQQYAIVRYSSEGQHCPHGGQCPQLGREVGVAAADLLRERLVSGWHAFDGIRDPYL